MKRLALEEVLNSRTFERAELLKRFLRYVCEMENAGRQGEINEYTIAVEALGRPSSYSPAGDSSVRSRAHAVREKLAAFYAAEGTCAPLRIELHKGSYVPHYVSRDESTPDELLAELVPAPETPVRNVMLRGFLAGALGTAVAASILFLFTRPAAPTDPVPVAVRQFWGPILQPGSDVVLCVATAPSLLLHSYHEGTFPPPGSFFSVPDEVTKWYRALHMQDGGGRLYSQVSQNTTLFGDDLAAVAALKVLGAAGKPVQVLPEYGVHRLALRGRNVLLIGSPNYSPFAASILRSAPFSVRYNAEARLEVISGNPSGPDAGTEYRMVRGDSSRPSRAYGLITVLQGIDPGDAAHRIVLFSGITGGGTQAAMEFFASPDSLRLLRRKMHLSDAAPLPPFYQVVVSCELVTSLAFSPQYETHRVLDSSPALVP